MIGVATVGLAQSGRPGPQGPCVVYTTAADFGQGHLFNLQVDKDPATGETCLRLNSDPQTWPYIAVAISGTNPSGSPIQVRRGSIMRIATEDLPLLGIGEGDVLGEYFTAPLGAASNPSRTTVDGHGNVWVGNRDEASSHLGGPKGSVTRIGLAIGGTRVDAAGNPNPAGDYLAGPFDYCTCEDRDGDGLIKTSRGYAHNFGALNSDWQPTALPWAAGQDPDDECITAYVRVDPTNVRHVSVDGNNDVWVGSWANKKFVKIDGATALPVASSAFTHPYGGYGGLVDSCGILWSANWDSNPSQNRLMRYDPATNSIADFQIPCYGLAFDPADCTIWSSYPYDLAEPPPAGFGGHVRRISPTGSLLNTYGVGPAQTNRGITIDNGTVWVANSSGNTVRRISTAGTGLQTVALGPISHNSGPLVFGSTPHGVSADRAGKIWASNRVSQNAMRIDPSTNLVDLAVDLGPDAWAYNYSDQTGDVLLKTAPQGTWTFIHDGGKTGCVWSTLDWTALLSGGSSVQVQVRASDLPLPSGPWTTVQANVPITGVVGQYLQVQVTLTQGVTPAGADGCCRPFGEAAICDLTICKEPGCSAEIDELICALDGSGAVAVNFSVSNNSGLDAHHVLITPMPPGSPVVATPNVISQFIPTGSSASLSTSFTGILPNSNFCFVVTLLDASMQSCCSVELCFTSKCFCLQVRDETEEIICNEDGTFTYTFQFDNLTQDVLHHLYLFPPSGVTMSPNYVALVPPVAPLGTSAPITVTISGATPGATLCFMISIHNIGLFQCCAKEHCIELPTCIEPDVFGACCYKIPGVPQPICAVMTDQECHGLGGVFQGPNTGCAPSPCLPPPPADSVHLTAFSRCCWPQTSVATSTLTICNGDTIAQTYAWSIASLPGAGCTHVIPPGFISPGSGVVTIPAGGCASIPITVICKGLLNGLPSATACLAASVTNVATNVVTQASGTVNSVVVPGGANPALWCAIPLVGQSDPVGIPDEAAVSVGFTLTNANGPLGAIQYTIAAGGVVQLNGNAPGSTLSGYVEAGAGESVDLVFSASFAELIAHQVFDIVLFADLDGDGVQEAATSFGVILAPPTPAPGCRDDLNGDNVVDGGDLGLLLNQWGSNGSADLNGDGVVDGADLGLMLNAWGPCN